MKRAAAPLLPPAPIFPASPAPVSYTHLDVYKRQELAKAKREYENVRSALEQVEATGYGIVMPTVSELKLEQPQIVRRCV